MATATFYPSKVESDGGFSNYTYLTGSTTTLASKSITSAQTADVILAYTLSSLPANISINKLTVAHNAYVNSVASATVTLMSLGIGKTPLSSLAYPPTIKPNTNLTTTQTTYTNTIDRSIDSLANNWTNNIDASFRTLGLSVQLKWSSNSTTAVTLYLRLIPLTVDYSVNTPSNPLLLGEMF